MSQVYFNHTTKLEAVKRGFIPATTIALQKVGNNFRYGVAICSKYDNFSKKYGRAVAVERLEKGFRETPIPEGLLQFGEEAGEKAMCIAFLYQLAGSVSANHKKWKKKVTKFNMAQAAIAEAEAKQAKVISLPNTEKAE